MFKNKLVDTSKYEDSGVVHPNENFPKHPYRWLFSGSSGSGKTNCLINALGQLYFDKIHIICPTAHTQPKYRYLADKLNKEDAVIQKELDKKYKGKYHLEPRIELHESIPIDMLEILNPEQQNLVVLDDCLCVSKKEEKQITDLFIRGRHRNCSLIYLTQSFYKVPRPIRLNCGAFNLFHSTSPSELSNLHKEMGLSSTKQRFVSTISKLLEPSYTFVHINIDSEKPFRKSDMVSEIKFS